MPQLAAVLLELVRHGEPSRKAHDAAELLLGRDGGEERDDAACGGEGAGGSAGRASTSSGRDRRRAGAPCEKPPSTILLASMPLSSSFWMSAWTLATLLRMPASSSLVGIGGGLLGETMLSSLISNLLRWGSMSVGAADSAAGGRERNAPRRHELAVIRRHGDRRSAGLAHESASSSCSQQVGVSSRARQDPRDLKEVVSQALDEGKAARRRERRQRTLAGGPSEREREHVPECAAAAQTAVCEAIVSETLARVEGAREEDGRRTAER